MKTDVTSQVGKHAFEIAGLGLAPFRFIGASENVITYPDGSQQAGGTCDYCGTGIRTECRCVSADGKSFVVGCNCIAKVGDSGLMKAYKSSPEYRTKQRQLKCLRDQAVNKELTALIDEKSDALRQLPHPRQFTDRETGRPLTAFDWAKWMFDNCGAAGRKSLLTSINQVLSKASLA